METKGNILADKSLDFGERMVNCFKFLSAEKKEYVMSNQLPQSCTVCPLGRQP